MKEEKKLPPDVEYLNEFAKDIGYDVNAPVRKNGVTDKEIPLWFKLLIKFKYNVLNPFGCFLFGHSYYRNGKMFFCPTCLKKLD